jgi:hypothetical protein
MSEHEKTDYLCFFSKWLSSSPNIYLMASARSCGASAVVGCAARQPEDLEAMG